MGRSVCIAHKSKSRSGVKFADADTLPMDSDSDASTKPGVFPIGKLVVLDVPRSVGPPFSNFKGQDGIVQTSRNTADGVIYSVLFEFGQPGDEMPHGCTLDEVPEKWLRRGGSLAGSSNVQHLSVSAILQACRVHRIPVFQRRYCWTESHWRRLWKSIVTVKDNGDLNNHSLGRLMLFERTNDSRLVLDGQQRLTTLIILLAAVRDRLVEVCDTSTAQEISKLCAVDRFFPTMDDREDFQRCLHEVCPEGDSALLQAKCVFVSLCSCLDEDACEKMVDATLNRLSMTCFFIKNADSIQAVFENMARKSQQMEQLAGSAQDLSSCVVCYADGDGGKVVASTHWGATGERLCSDCAAKSPDSEPMTPGMPMVPVDLIRNFVFDHFASEAAMRQAHADYWSPLEAKYKNNAGGLEEAFIAFLENRGFPPSSCWALYVSFTDWWCSGTKPAGGREVEELAIRKMKEILQAI